MYRSFTNRVFGGVCGGLGDRFHMNPWWVRGLFILLTLLSAGAIGLLYVLLWWTLPVETLAQSRRYTTGWLWFLLLVVVVGAAWIGRDMGWLQSPTGESLYGPGMLLVSSSVFFWRQLRGS